MLYINDYINSDIRLRTPLIRYSLKDSYILMDVL